MSYVPYPNDRWNEIIPGLYQGGQVASQHWTDGSWVTVGSEFGAVYSLYWGGPQVETYGPDPDVPHVHFQIPDGKLDEEELDTLRVMAQAIRVRIQQHDRVLVRCQAGYNRSGLLVAFVLLEMGMGADEAIALIRAKRSEYALCNEDFVDYILKAGAR